MPPDIKFLVLRYTRQGHPLAQPIQAVEFPELISRLERLFDMRGVMLPPSPHALPHIRDAAAACAENAAHSIFPLTDFDHLLYVRGLTAYLGRAILDLSHGNWRKGEHLLNAWVQEAGCLVLTRGTQRVTITHLSLAVGYLAADVWEAALAGSRDPLDVDLAAFARWPDGHTAWKLSRRRFPFGDPPAPVD